MYQYYPKRCEGTTAAAAGFAFPSEKQDTIFISCGILSVLILFSEKRRRLVVFLLLLFMTWFLIMNYAESPSSSSWFDGDSKGYKELRKATAESAERQLMPASCSVFPVHPDAVFSYHHHPFSPHPHVSSQLFKSGLHAAPSFTSFFIWHPDTTWVTSFSLTKRRREGKIRFHWLNCNW